MNPVINALKFRHACKQFDPSKKVGKKNLDLILEAACLSPSSFGMEAWKFLVLESKPIREKLRPACWDQSQVTDSSHVIAILARPAVIDPDQEYVLESFQRRGLSEDTTKAYVERYKHYIDTEVDPIMPRYAWCAKQCYIALSNIMTCAASLGIDSCPMEGYEKNRVEEILEIDTDAYQVAVLVALGYRAGQQTPRFRRDQNQLIEIL